MEYSWLAAYNFLGRAVVSRIFRFFVYPPERDSTA
jgi:hypothetical protein